jgi:hypothetical protein
MKDITKSKELLLELYWRNSEGHAYADVSSNAVKPNPDIHLGKPIFKNTAGKRLMLDEKDQINPDKIVRYLNIKAKVFIGNETPKDKEEAYYK